MFDNNNTLNIFAVKILEFATNILLPSVAINLNVKCIINKIFNDKNNNIQNKRTFCFHYTKNYIT